MKECNEIENNSYSTVRTVRTVHDNEIRAPTEIRLRRSIHRAVKQYCVSEHINIGQLYEEAVILFMDLNPIDFNPINITKQERVTKSSIQSEMQEFVCLDDMREFVERLGRDDKTNNNLYKIRRIKFIELLKECNKVKIWGDELSALVMQARNHFE